MALPVETWINKPSKNEEARQGAQMRFHEHAVDLPG
jgi:hypothetical protein